MKKHILKISFLVVVLSTAIYGISTMKGKKTNIIGELESMAACESIGWWNNNGNCVSNNRNEYFCKTDSWYWVSDCLQ